MKYSKRMDNFGESIFTTLTAMKRARETAGGWVCDFSIGSPNVPPAQHIIDTVVREAADPVNYKYAIKDLPELQNAVAQWYQTRYGIALDPGAEICSLLGSQEGLTHIGMAFLNEGDITLVPDPCYPAFADGVGIAGGSVHYMPMRPENNCIIQLSDIPADVAKAAKMMIVSYPNNPTSALAPDGFYRDLIAFAREYDIIVIHDNAYSDLVYDGKTAGSFLRFEGAKDVGVEFNSLSKTYGLAGARIGFCIGNADVVKGVRNLKSNMDYGMFIPVQKMAIAAITGDQNCVAVTRAAYEHRRDILFEGLNSIGWKIDKPASTMVAWARIPQRYDSSMAFTKELFEKCGVLVAPGSAFGPSGEGFVRMALVQDDDTIKKAISGMGASGIFD